jgi:transcriptional regulator with XRE-family HTH domain
MQTATKRKPKSVLQLIREGQGKSRRECADALRVDVNTWKRWELGYHPPTALNLLDIGAYLGVPAEALRPITQRSPDHPNKRRGSAPPTLIGQGELT